MVTGRKVLLNLIGSTFAFVLLAAVAQATVPRAFVSINGSDTNPCSAVQPCRSFNQALAVVQAGGEIVVQDSGGYSTGFTITQSVTIDAAGFNASAISTTPGSELCTVSTGPSDRVVLRGISFHGANVGDSAIFCTQVGSLYVEHCSISEFNGDGILMEGSGNLRVSDCDVRKIFDSGVEAFATGSASSNAVVQDSRFTDCGFGVLLLTGGAGIATGLVSNCTASKCPGGFELNVQSSANSQMTLTNCRAFDDNVGVECDGLLANATLYMRDCVVTQNVIGVRVQSANGGVGTLIGTSPGTNLIAGNGTNGATSSAVTMQ